MIKGNIVTALTVFLLSLGLSVYISLQEKVGMMGGQIIDPNTWSLILVIGLIFFSLVLLIRYGLQLFQSEPSLINEDAPRIDKADRITMLLFGVLSALYIVSLKYIGYILGTILYLAITYRFLGVRGMKKIILLPLILVAIFVLVFGRLLYISLPKGVGIFYEITSIIVG